MKKILFAAVLAMSLMVVLACHSGPIETQEEVDDAFQRVYNEFRGDLVLDGAQAYTVVPGDTLSAIARAKYQNGFYFPLIMLASSDIVLDPDQIDPGMKLTVPDLQKNLHNARAISRFKGYLEEIAKVEDRRSRPADAQGLRDLAASL